MVTGSLGEAIAGHNMRLTVDLVDVALDLGLCEELIVDVPLCFSILYLLETHNFIVTCPKIRQKGNLLMRVSFSVCVFFFFFTTTEFRHCVSELISPSPWF